MNTIEKTNGGKSVFIWSVCIGKNIHFKKILIHKVK